MAKDPWSNRPRLTPADDGLFPRADPRDIRSNILQGPVAEMVAYVRKARDLRKQFLDPELFGEPAWDILLDLYSANLAQKRVPVGAVCIASGVPPTTAIRWLRAMETKGLIRRRPDPTHGRRIFVELCPEVTAAMDALFVALGAQLPDLHKSR